MFGATYWIRTSPVRIMSSRHYLYAKVACVVLYSTKYLWSSDVWHFYNSVVTVGIVF